MQAPVHERIQALCQAPFPARKIRRAPDSFRWKAGLSGRNGEMSTVPDFLNMVFPQH